MAFLDRVNIGNAAIFGLKEDLNLGGVEYNVALTIFFVPYILFEIPSNLILKKARPRIWQPPLGLDPLLVSTFTSSLPSLLQDLLIHDIQFFLQNPQPPTQDGYQETVR